MPAIAARATVVPLLLLCLAAGGCAALAGGSGRATVPSPPSGVIESLEILHDASRGRDVPIKIYAPREGDGPFPVIVFSHGLGSSRQGYVYLGREWANRGYVAIHLQHVGSDSEVLRTKGLRAIYHAAYDAKEYAERPYDVSFVIDTLEARARERSGEIWGKLDLARIGVGGHSYGAHTALTLAGMLVNFPDDPGRSFRDERVKAALILSPPSMEWSPSPEAFVPISVPTMHMSGTRDRSRLWKTTLAHRRRAFDGIHGAPRFFLDIDGATHQTFADRETIGLAKRNGRLDRDDPPALAPRDAEHQRHVDLILEYSDLFWDAYLRDSNAARAKLQFAAPAGAVLERGE
jgi:predicted dienelactone hydrolase